MTAKDIKELRLSLGETQTQFGKRFYIGKKQVSHWETGYSSPVGQKLKALKEMIYE